jgi:hypothetical protein
MDKMKNYVVLNLKNLSQSLIDNENYNDNDNDNDNDDDKNSN